MHSSIMTSKLALVALFASTLVNSTPVPLEERSELFKRAPVALGLAKSFGAISYTTLTSTGATVLTGNGGTWPGSSITGWPPASVSGSLSRGGVLAQNGKSACLTAYNAAWAKLPTAVALPSVVLGGITLGPGVYKFPASSVTLTGTLTLDGASNPSGQFVFLINTTFSTSALSKIKLINGAKACNVIFANGSSATIGAASELQGNILSFVSIAASNAATNFGTWCALNGAVTLINNQLTAQAGTCVSV